MNHSGFHQAQAGVVMFKVVPAEEGLAKFTRRYSMRASFIARSAPCIACWKRAGKAASAAMSSPIRPGRGKNPANDPHASTLSGTHPETL